MAARRAIFLRGGASLLCLVPPAQGEVLVAALFLCRSAVALYFYPLWEASMYRLRVQQYNRSFDLSRNQERGKGGAAQTKREPYKAG